MTDEQQHADEPDPLHLRPEGVSDDAVAAVGKMNEAVEMIERARGHLYAFHQLTGYADELLDDVIASAEGDETEGTTDAGTTAADKQSVSKTGADAASTSAAQTTTMAGTSWRWRAK